MAVISNMVFAYRVALHESTQESPFFLLYGRDARTPTETALTQCRTPYQVDISDYKSEMTESTCKFPGLPFLSTRHMDHYSVPNLPIAFFTLLIILQFLLSLGLLNMRVGKVPSI